MLAVVKHFDLALDEEFNIVLLWVVLGCMEHFLVFSLLGCLSIFWLFVIGGFDTGELHVDLCVVRVKEVAQYLNVVLVGNVEGLFHGGTL